MTSLRTALLTLMNTVADELPSLDESDEGDKTPRVRARGPESGSFPHLVTRLLLRLKSHDNG